MENSNEEKGVFSPPSFKSGTVKISCIIKDVAVFAKSNRSILKTEDGELHEVQGDYSDLVEVIESYNLQFIETELMFHKQSIPDEIKDRVSYLLCEMRRIYASGYERKIAELEDKLLVLEKKANEKKSSPLCPHAI